LLDGEPIAMDLDQLLAAGIDGLFSDDPAAARAALRRLSREAR
jgi:glycerophosphoryl diester phosphodiesterase